MVDDKLNLTPNLQGLSGLQFLVQNLQKSQQEQQQQQVQNQVAKQQSETNKQSSSAISSNVNSHGSTGGNSPGGTSKENTSGTNLLESLAGLLPTNNNNKTTVPETPVQPLQIDCSSEQNNKPPPASNNLNLSDLDFLNLQKQIASTTDPAAAATVNALLIKLKEQQNAQNQAVNLVQQNSIQSNNEPASSLSGLLSQLRPSPISSPQPNGQNSNNSFSNGNGANNGQSSNSNNPDGWTFEEQFKQLYDLDNDGSRRKFLDDLFSFMQKRGTPVNRIPIMAKQVLDLYKLYKLVVEKGGLVEVINKKIWREITKGLNLPSSITSAAFTLRTQYMKYLYPFECEKEGLSNPAELQAAIDGNRREGRRPTYGSPSLGLSNLSNIISAQSAVAAASQMANMAAAASGAAGSLNGLQNANFANQALAAQAQQNQNAAYLSAIAAASNGDPTALMRLQQTALAAQQQQQTNVVAQKVLLAQAAAAQQQNSVTMALEALKNQQNGNMQQSLLWFGCFGENLKNFNLLLLFFKLIKTRSSAALQQKNALNLLNLNQTVQQPIQTSPSQSNMLDELKKKLFEMSKTETTPATSQAINLNAIQNTITSNNSNNTNNNNNNISNTNNNPSTAAENLLANLATNNSSTQSTLSVVNEPDAKMPKLEHSNSENKNPLISSSGLITTMNQSQNTQAEQLKKDLQLDQTNKNTSLMNSIGDIQCKLDVLNRTNQSSELQINTSLENQEKMEAEEMEEGEPEISQDKINDKDHGIIRRDDGKKMAYQNLEIFSSNSSEDTGICLSIVVNGVTYAGKLHVLGLEKFDAL